MGWLTIANAIIQLAIGILQQRADAGKADAERAKVLVEIYQKAFKDAEEAKKIKQEVAAMPDSELDNILRDSSPRSASKDHQL